MPEIRVSSVNPVRITASNADKTIKKSIAKKKIRVAENKIGVQKEKKSHKALKVALGVAFAVGAYVLLKKTGLDTKVKDYAVKLKDKVSQLIKGSEKVAETTAEGSKVLTPSAGEKAIDKAAQKAKEIAESINKPFSTSAKTIEKNLGMNAAVKSAEESAKIFEQAGLTSTEKALQKVEQQAIRSQRYPYYYIDKYEAEMAQKLKAQQVEEMWKYYYSK